MKTIKYLMLVAFLFAFAACSSDGEVRHLGVTSVKTLLSLVAKESPTYNPNAFKHELASAPTTNM